MSQSHDVSDHDSDDERDPSSRPAPDRILRAEDLFGSNREVWIDLEGVRYRLRITRRGKLILQK